MMNKKLIATVVLAGILVVACQSKTKNGDSMQSETSTQTPVDLDTMQSGSSVPYTEAKRYFVKNTYANNQVEELKITTVEEFERIFGTAAVMGKDGTPTPIDFSKQYVLAVIGTPTNLETTLTLTDLKQEGDSIVIDYQMTEGNKQSYTIQPSLVIVVDHQFSGEPKFQRK